MEKCSRMNDHDKFGDVMKPFYEYAEKKYKGVKDLDSRVKKELNKIGIWLNEGKDINCLYLKTINQFCKEFVQTEKNIMSKREKARKAEERAKYKEATKWKRKNGGASGSSVRGGVSLGGGGDRDEESKSTAFSDVVLRDLQATTSSEFVGLVRKSFIGI